MSDYRNSVFLGVCVGVVCLALLDFFLFVLFSNDERRTTNDERRTANDERRTANDDDNDYDYDGTHDDEFDDYHDCDDGDECATTPLVLLQTVTVTVTST